MPAKPNFSTPYRVAILVLFAMALVAASVVPATAARCTFWVGKTGSDSASGSRANPWATVTHAVQAVPDNSCTILVKNGVYREAIEIERRFQTSVTIRATHAYKAVFERGSTVLDIDGARAITVSGFVFRHDGPGASGQVINVDNGGGIWADLIVLRNNVIHDSYDDDLLKIHAGVKRATVANNVFYNQGPNEQHMDVNSVTDVTIRDNIFFNDFSRSNRGEVESKHFIVVKDSGAFDDGLNGAERIAIRRNIFMNWEGNAQSFVQVGNDGKPYYEAKDVRLENNLFLGNSPQTATTPLGVSGARDVEFVNNTVVGDLPTKAYGFRLSVKGDNPVNRNLVFANNMWSDPTGTMDDFSGGDAGDARGLVLDNNLYWNDGKTLPSGDAASPRDDTHRIVANPGLLADHRDVVLPIWNGSQFDSGVTTIRSEFKRLVAKYASIPETSAAVDRSNPAFAPSDDILGQARGNAADLGAFESSAVNIERCAGLPATHVGTPGDDTIIGTPQWDVIVGGRGDDVIYGLDGNDVICGGAGNDTLIGGPGADTLGGGPGRDIIEGRAGSDRINGGGGPDRLYGNGGRDLMQGNSGDDRIWGGPDGDRLFGRSGDDRLDGGSGADRAVGGAGRDECINAEEASCESVTDGSTASSALSEMHVASSSGRTDPVRGTRTRPI